MANWKIDVAHSEIGFKIKHLVISTVSGKFTSFEGNLDGDPQDLTKASLSFTADVDSIHTGNEQRDGHLKSADFFDVSNHPKLSFRSTSIAGKGEGVFKVTGDLTLRGVTKSISFTAEFGGTQTDFYGQTVAGFEISGKLNRQDFGLTWSAVTEAGGIVVSDEVKLVIAIELVKQAESASIKKAS